MDVQAIVFSLSPVRIIAEAMDSHTLEAGILGKPFPGPVVFYGAGSAPSLPGTAAETMHKDKVYNRTRGRVQQVQSKGPFGSLYSHAGGSGRTKEARAEFKGAAPSRDSRR